MLLFWLYVHVCALWGALVLGSGERSRREHGVGHPRWGDDVPLLGERFSIHEDGIDDYSYILAFVLLVAWPAILGVLCDHLHKKKISAEVGLGEGCEVVL